MAERFLAKKSEGGRHMKMQQIVNFRDMGGLRCEDGRTVKHGHFFRSSLIDMATEHDIKQINDLQIKHIFDYRDLDERYFDRDIYARLNAAHHRVPAAFKNDKLLRLSSERSLRALRDKFTLEDIHPTYRNLPIDNQGYKAMFKAVAEKDVPIWQHCSAGKDRAGVGCALLAKLLGVVDEDILADYMQSAEAYKFFKDIVGKSFPWIVRRYALKQIDPLLIVDPSFLHATFDAVTEKYGSWASYFESEYGLGPDKVTELRNHYCA